jgi:hypothetical protein
MIRVFFYGSSLDGRDQSAVAIKVGAEATASKTSRRDGGRDLPRFAARRMIPAQAFGLKKNRGGTSPVSKICDNEDAAPPLGNSEVLSVKNPVGEPIPELAQPSEEGTKSPCFI